MKIIVSAIKLKKKMKSEQENSPKTNYLIIKYGLKYDKV